MSTDFKYCYWCEDEYEVHEDFKTHLKYCCNCGEYV